MAARRSLDIVGQADRQKGKQTDKKAIGDCVLAKISELGDHSDDDNDDNGND